MKNINIICQNFFIHDSLVSHTKCKFLNNLSKKIIFDFIYNSSLKKDFA